ncbi:MAG TPA: hypothetical protein VMP68_00575 [Candidatus Eisenbacteria bacterium]|nr:hypothetical protein [Candidatus Eisenbacteria bacterium]
MTLIVALKGKDHVSMVGDTLEMREQGAAMYCRYRRKIRKINGEWVIGVSGCLHGLQVVEDLGEQKIDGLSENLSEAIKQLAQKLHRGYSKKNFVDDCWFLLIGFNRGVPFIWNWHFAKKKTRSQLVGPWEQQDIAAVGTVDHGALYFAHQFLSRQMQPSQTALLGLHCVSEVSNHDRRVKGPFTVAISEQTGTQIYSEDKLNRLLERSTGITTSISAQFSATDITL